MVCKLACMCSGCMLKFINMLWGAFYSSYLSLAAVMQFSSLVASLLGLYFYVHRTFTPTPCIAYACMYS